MSSRPQFNPYIVIPNADAQPANSGDMSQASLISAPTIIQKLSMISYSYSWSGATPIGIVEVELSNDFSLNVDGSVKNPGTWNVMTLNYNGTAVTSIPVTGNTGNGLVDIDATGAFAIRTVYTKTSGTGQLQVTICAKVA